MRRLIQFVTNMDAKAWRSLAVSFVLFGGVGLVFVFGAQALGFDGEATLEGWLDSVHGPLALPAAVVVFGPARGFAYSWVGTMVSALVGFYLGRIAGAKTLDRLSSEGVRKFTELVGRNGFLASLVVRLVPSAPFIVVNMAAGVTPMPVSRFAAGTAIGIVPKIALTAFAGASIVQAMKGQGGSAALWLALIAAAWLALGFVARRWLKSREDPD